MWSYIIWCLYQEKLREKQRLRELEEEEARRRRDEMEKYKDAEKILLVIYTCLTRLSVLSISRGRKTIESISRGRKHFAWKKSFDVEENKLESISHGIKHFTWKKAFRMEEMWFSMRAGFVIINNNKNTYRSVIYWLTKHCLEFWQVGQGNTMGKEGLVLVIGCHLDLSTAKGAHMS